MTKKPKAAKTAPTKLQKSANPKALAKQVFGKGANSASPRTTKGTVWTESKQARVIEMMRRSDDVTIQHVMDFTGWQMHSVYGFLSGIIKKKLGLNIISNKAKDGVRTYHIKVA